jgi:hypothetical protein
VAEVSVELAFSQGESPFGDRNDPKKRPEENAWRY